MTLTASVLVASVLRNRFQGIGVDDLVIAIDARFERLALDQGSFSRHQGFEDQRF